MLLRTVIVLVAGLVLMLPAYAARPLATDDAGTVDPGSVELETGYDYANVEDKDKAESMNTTIKHGLSKRLDLAITLPKEIRPQEGLDRSYIGVKFVLLEAKDKLPAVSLTFTSCSGSSACAYNGICSHCWHPVTMHLNLGYNATGEVGVKGSTTYSAAIEYPLSKRLTLVGEVLSEAVWGEKNPLESLVGCAWSISKDVTFDLGIGLGHTSVCDDWKISSGLTYSF